MEPASIAPPSAEPAPTTRCSSSTNTTIAPSAAVTSSMTAVRRSSNSPRYFVPATIPARSSAIIRTPRSTAGTSPSAIRAAMPSAIAVLPTPGSPTSTGLFLDRRPSTSSAASISASRPITGSSRPARASAVRSRPNRSSPRVPRAPGGRASGVSPNEPSRFSNSFPTSDSSGPNASRNGSSGTVPPPGRRPAPDTDGAPPRAFVPPARAFVPRERAVSRPGGRPATPPGAAARPAPARRPARPRPARRGRAPRSGRRAAAPTGAR